ncbi:MAG: Ribosomal RNA small subunit methyltransferase A [Parcubacteria group bacterium GW2011_GWB1_41_5]|nr:MAG: Ribosomal RNA small subunit methyltransferase A [Parcubacteria group bacterium GW2011_GWB1_41_5]
MGLQNKYVFARAKKALGQNFLKSEEALWQIIEAEEIKPGEIILEIGPGRGALTNKLLETRCEVLAIEKDRELYEFLKIKFEKEISSGQLNLVHGDILEFEITNYELRNYKVIANIPYNITGAILKKFLTGKNQPKGMVLMVQREVATRILAKNGKESILSISVKAYGEPKMIAKVDKRYFSPVPKVNSAIIAIKNISRKVFEDNKIDETKFWQIVKTGFAHKRKKLSGNLKNVISAEKLERKQLQDKRAEDLTLEDWIVLASREETNRPLGE